ALNRNPNYADARAFLCDIYWGVAVTSRRGWQEYITEADKLLKLRPKDHKTYFRRGLAESNLASVETPGQMARQAIDDMEKAISLKSDEPAYWLGLIHFLGRLPGRQDQVEQTFRRAVKAMPEDPSILISFAAFLRKQGKNDQARRYLDKAIAKDPVTGNLALSDHFMALGRLDDALTVLEKVKAIDRLDARAYIRQARILARQGKSTEAISVLKDGLAAVDAVAATQPDDAHRRQGDRSRLDLNYLMTDLLLDMLERGQGDRRQLLAEVRERMRKMTLLNLRGPLRARMAGRIALAEGRVDQAVKELETAFRTAPGFDLKVANLLINIYLKQNLPGKADRILDRLLSIPGQRQNVSALLAKARLLMRYRDFDKADRLVTRVLDIDPKNDQALNLKTVLLAVRGDTPSLPAGIKPTTDTLKILLDRASELWLDGRRDQAIRYVEQLYRRAPKQKPVITRLFAMYRSAGRLDDAQKLIDEALKVYPDDKTLQARRELIRQKDPAKQRRILMAMADEYPPLQRALEKAVISKTFGDDKQYIRYLREAEKINPNARSVVERLFRYALVKKDWKLASDCAARARQANLDGANGAVYRARLALARGDNDAAITACQAALEPQPQRKDARVLLGQAYLNKHLYDKAYEAFKMVADNDPAFAPALVGLAAVTQYQGKDDEHRLYVRSAYRLVPQDPYIRQRYFAIQRASVSPEQLIAERERALKRQPDDALNVLGLGRLYERVNRLDDAEKMYLRFHELSKDKLYSARVLCGFYLRQGRLDDVRKVMDPLLTASSDAVGVRVLYGQLLSLADPQKAKSFFEKAITINADDPRGHLGLARFWAVQRQWAQAVQAMTAYVRLKPEDIAGVKELVRYSIEAGEYAPAEKRLDEILHNDPTDAAALTLKGMLALRRGQIDKAMGFFTQAIQDNPNYAEPLVYRAQLYLARGEPTKAKSDLQKA
ncbi:MAG: tetratricopeptide repeat protein, partial [Planctomycetes bacterium]|nr:tetratricopeptide repeat protein [Planctomycetota bacterium]